MRVVEQQSVLGAPAEKVWARVSTFEGINDELRPLMRMTAPARVRSLDPGMGPLLERVVRATFRHRKPL